MDDAIDKWMEHHPWLVVRAIPIAIFAVGVSLMIGAVKDWDTFYKPDERDEPKWSLGQTSRYWGRGTARVLGFLLGMLLSFCGLVLCYAAFFNSK